MVVRGWIPSLPPSCLSVSWRCKEKNGHYEPGSRCSPDTESARAWSWTYPDFRTVRNNYWWLKPSRLWNFCDMSLNELPGGSNVCVRASCASPDLQDLPPFPSESWQGFRSQFNKPPLSPKAMAWGWEPTVWGCTCYLLTSSLGANSYPQIVYQPHSDLYKNKDPTLSVSLFPELSTGTKQVLRQSINSGQINECPALKTDLSISRHLHIDCHSRRV